MSSGVWITLLIFAFVVGSVLGLKPSARQKALGTLRERGRALGLQPKLVACPDWLINANGKKGEGMVALYGFVVEDGQLPMSHALVIDGEIKVTEGDISLTNQPCSVDDALGITMQANFIGFFIKETLYGGEKNTVEYIDKRLHHVKNCLQSYVEKVQTLHPTA